MSLWQTRGGSATHSDDTAYFGSERALYFIPRIAKVFFIMNKGARLLSLNDMSLPKGGLFDNGADWTAGVGHQTHREGNDVDINTKGSVPCIQDQALRLAVDGLLIPEKRKQNSALYCKGLNQAKAHIDFTGLAE